MAAKKGQYQIPFDTNGNQLDYPMEYWRTAQNVWVDNFEFVDTLTYVEYHQGRSAVGFTFKRTDETTVNVFISDFSAMLPFMKLGTIAGRFTFVKKGKNYGCTMIEPLGEENK